MLQTFESLLLTCLRITNFAVVEITPIGIENLGWRFWIVFTVFCAISLPIIYFLYPETANRSLEDLDAYYRESPPLIVTRNKDAVQTRRPRRFVDEEAQEIERAASIGGEAIHIGTDKGGAN